MSVSGPTARFTSQMSRAAGFGGSSMAILERPFQRRFPTIVGPERFDAIEKFFTPATRPALAPVTWIQMTSLVAMLVALGVGVATYLGFHHRLMSFNDAFGHV